MNGSRIFHDYLKYIFGQVFKQIEISVTDKLGFSKIPKVHKLTILPDFKEFSRWLKS